MPRQITPNWTIEDATDIADEYTLTDDEKEGLTSDEQEVWKTLKTVRRRSDTDIESEIARVMSAEIAKEIDATVLNSLLGIMNGTSTK